MSPTTPENAPKSLTLPTPPVRRDPLAPLTLVEPTFPVPKETAAEMPFIASVASMVAIAKALVTEVKS